MIMINCSIIDLLSEILDNSRKDDALLGVTVWTIGQIGKHSAEHSNVIASANLFPKLLSLYLSPASSHDLRTKCKTTFKYCLQKCLLLSALDPLLYEAPASVMKYILAQYSKVSLYLEQTFSFRVFRTYWSLHLNLNTCFGSDAIFFSK